MTKCGTLRGYPYFKNALLIFINEYGKAVTVGMYAGEPWQDTEIKLSWKQVIQYTGDSTPVDIYRT